jgi:hypothetical protein
MLPRLAVNDDETFLTVEDGLNIIRDSIEVCVVATI